MKTKLLTLVITGALLSSCEKDDDNIRVDRTIDNAFHSQYPNVTRVEWERKINYYVADFWQNNTESEAWYDHQGVWYMTETDVRYTDLPQAVRTAFEQSEYAAWRIDDIDMLEYPGRETIYIIETEQGKAECDLYYTPDGVLAKKIPEDINNVPDNSNNTNNNNNNNGSNNNNSNGETHKPSTVLPAIKDFIIQKYPQARIIDVDIEHNTIEVDIVDDRTPREIVFTSTGEWTYTETEVRKANVPATILNALSASKYGSWRIDDIDHYATPAGEYYRFELESGHSEVLLKINIDGNLL